MSTVNQITLMGRIKVRDKLTNSFATIITLPAPDEYSSPQSVRVISVKSLGQKGDDVTIEARPCGFHRVNVGKRPNADGELPRFNNCDGYFSAIE